ncbi:phosphatidylglycerophosphatase [Alcanivorax sp. PN-3]|nr:phosphatidylglycerophosphatase [Alcanivorax sp. PN-3]
MDITNPVHWFAFGFGSGLSPVAPGTAGSALALLLWWWLARLPMPWYLLLVLALSLAEVWICGSTSGQLGLHDPSAVVWDEWVGLWLALAGLPRRWWWGTAGFVVFRLFDVIKAGPVGWADHAMPGGWGIVADDLFAGVMALAVLWLFRAVWQRCSPLR